MPPQALQLGLFVLEEAIKLSPGLYGELAALFSKPEPTAQDWATLRAKIASRTYESYDPGIASAD